MELQKLVWDGKIAVCFSLAEESANATAAGEVAPCFMYISRVSYLATAYEKLRKHFEKFVSNAQDEIWCDYNNEPLKWQYPAGLLYDLTTYNAGKANQGNSPWLVTVHFGDYPTNELLHCTSPETIESLYLATLKEADFLVHSKRIVDQLQKRDFKQLWNSLVNDKFDQFWSINRRMHESPTYSHDDAQLTVHEESNAGAGEKLSLRYFAFRIYVQSVATRRLYVVQKLVKPFIEKDGKKLRTTLRDVILQCLPDAPIEHSNNADQRIPFSVVIHGIEFTDLSVPFEWMAEHLSYPENFLHIAILGYPK